MSTWVLPRAPLSWPLFCAEGPTTPPPNLGFFHRVSPLLCEVLLSRGLTLLGANSCALITSHFPGGVSAFLSYHTRGSHLVMALSWVVSVPGSPNSGVDTSRVRFYPLLVLELMALEPPFFVTVLNRWGPMSFLGDVLSLGDVSACRCLFLGDASSGRPVDLPSLGPLRDPTMYLTLTSGQCPETGRYRTRSPYI